MSRRPKHVVEMSNAELSEFIQGYMKAVDEGGKDEMEAAAKAFGEIGIEAGCLTGVKAEDFTPKMTMVWYAGQIMQITNDKAWFCVNSLINCLDKFVVQPGRIPAAA